MSGHEAEVQRHGVVTRLFHWLTLLFVLIMVPVGMAITSQGFEEWKDPLYILHKGLGSLLLVFVILRIGWKLVHRGPPPPPEMPPLEARMASATHGLLLFLLLVMTVSGYTRVVGGGFPIEMLDSMGIPPLLPRMDVWADRMSVLHKFTAYLLVAAIAAHAAAAVHHAFARPGDFRRIWPPWGGNG